LLRSRRRFFGGSWLTLAEQTIPCNNGAMRPRRLNKQWFVLLSGTFLVIMMLQPALSQHSSSTFKWTPAFVILMVALNMLDSARKAAPDHKQRGLMLVWGALGLLSLGLSAWQFALVL